MNLIFIYLFFSALFLIYTCFWVDFALINMISQTRPLFNNLLKLIDFRTSHRFIFANLFIFTLVVFLVIQLFLLKHSKKIKFKKNIYLLLILIASFFSSSYPFLSKDIFSYLFGAKILWCYHHNPYTVPPEAFSLKDLWFGFTHNTEKTYNYPFVSLIYTLIPFVFFGCSKFISLFYSLKFLNTLIFLVGGWLIYKVTLDKRVIAFWFLNPFLLIELLSNSHNDLLMLVLFFACIYFLKFKKYFLSGTLFISSIFTKYISILCLPVVISSHFRKSRSLKLIFFILLLFYLRYSNQSWYFSWVYLALPFSKLNDLSLITIFIFQIFLLMVKYHGFVLTDMWGRHSFFGSFFKLMYFLPIILFILEFYIPKRYVKKL